ncbi:MAG TPA: hypothetical protein VLL54_03295 [Pyrinomonadaceae bacterium]|nr:hypothetical protein [Pyrinomonadaceae bacterium]
MNPPRLAWLAATTLLAIAGAALATGKADDVALKQIAGYRTWTRVNEKPVVVENPTGAD